MRKLRIFVILFTIILAGCGAYPAGIEGVETTNSEVVTTAKIETTATTYTTTSAATTTTPTTPLVTNKTAVKIQPATTTTDKTTEATYKKMEEKSINLNVETIRGDGTLTFTSVKLSYNKYVRMNQVDFTYKTSEKRAIMPETKKTYLLDKNGTKYIADGMGGAGDEGKITFYDIPDENDLSTVTLTYAFEGYDPVTVTFDIPGL